MTMGMENMKREGGRGPKVSLSTICLICANHYYHQKQQQQQWHNHE